MTERLCRTCGTTITAKSKSGLCRPCACKDPEIKAKKSASVKLAYQRDPVYLEEQRQRLLERNRSNKMRALAGKKAKELRIWEKGNAAMTPELRQRAGKTLSERRLSHIPPEVRDDYRRLTQNRFRRDEAINLVMDLHAHRMGKFIRKLVQESA